MYSLDKQKLILNFHLLYDFHFIIGKMKSKNPWEECPAYLEISVAWRDLDAYGHVNNAVYFSYFEMIRLHYFSQMPNMKKLIAEKGFLKGMREGDGNTMVLVNTSCTYKQQAFLGQSLILTMQVTKVRRSLVDMTYQIFDKESGVLVAKGSSVHAVVDAQSFKAKRISDTFLGDLEAMEKRKLQ